MGVFIFNRPFRSPMQQRHPEIQKEKWTDLQCWTLNSAALPNWVVQWHSVIVNHFAFSDARASPFHWVSNVARFSLLQQLFLLLLTKGRGRATNCCPISKKRIQIANSNVVSVQNAVARPFSHHPPSLPLAALSWQTDKPVPYCAYTDPQSETGPRLLLNCTGLLPPL